MKSKYIRKSFKAIYGFRLSQKLILKNATALEKLIFLENKDQMYDRILTLIPIIRMVFENFVTLTKKSNYKVRYIFIEYFGLRAHPRTQIRSEGVILTLNKMTLIFQEI